MKNSARRNKIFFRCPSCGTAVVGFIGGLSNVSDMLRLKCECTEFAMDIKKQPDGKLRLLVPCVYCKDTHGYVIAKELADRDTISKLSCPYSGMDIAIIGDGEEFDKNIERTAEELGRIMQSLEAEELKDIQPQDEDEEAVPPDPAVYDSINFLVKDLESEGKVSCPCGNGKYDLRFIDGGIQVFCHNCGATKNFRCLTAAMAEDYLGLDEIILH